MNQAEFDKKYGAGKMKRLTKRQSEIVDFMRGYLAENDNMPTAADVAISFGFRSWNSASCYFKALEKKKIIERAPSNITKWRFVRSAMAGTGL